MGRGGTENFVKSDETIANCRKSKTGLKSKQLIPYDTEREKTESYRHKERENIYSVCIYRCVCVCVHHVKIRISH